MANIICSQKPPRTAAHLTEEKPGTAERTGETTKEKARPALEVIIYCVHELITLDDFNTQGSILPLKNKRTITSSIHTTERTNLASTKFIWRIHINSKVVFKRVGF